MRKAEDVFKAFLSQYNIKKGDTYFSFFSSWKEIAGRDIAAHSRLIDIRHNAAVIEIDHPAWMQMLQMKEKKVLSEMRRRFPSLSIRSLQMRLVDVIDWEKMPAGRAPKEQENRGGEEENDTETSAEQRDRTNAEVQKTELSGTEQNKKETGDADRRRFEHLLSRLEKEVKKGKKK